MLKEILRAAKGLPAGNGIELVFGLSLRPERGVNEYTGPLPAAIATAAGMMMDYRIYGTEEGCGTASGQGYKLTVSSNGIPCEISLGHDKLMKDEYVDYGSNRIMRRTAQLIGPDALDPENGWEKGVLLRYNGVSVSAETFAAYGFIPVEPDTVYYRRQSGNQSSVAGIWYYDEDKQLISAERFTGVAISVTTPENCRYVRFSYYRGLTFDYFGRSEITAAEDIPPYYSQEQPAVQLPVIPAFAGTTLITSPDVPEKVYLKYPVQNSSRQANAAQIDN
ncbi:MAG: hypothetical protein IJ806_10535 [Ruminococcus sp.]|nr:hypothetical protein [Ruminococcus sp.]